MKFDLKVTQQLPGFAESHKGEVFFVIDNLTNLLNDDWGTYKKGSFVGNRMVDMNIDSNGRYVYTGFNDGNKTRLYNATRHCGKCVSVFAIRSND